MIKTIIFDLDKMVHLSEDYFSTNIAKKYGIGQDLISEFFKKEYLLCRIGKLDTKDALKPYLKKWDFPGTVDNFLKIWFEYGKFDQEMLELIQKLRNNGIKCILVTNNEKNRIEHYEKELSVFDEVIASYMYGFCKAEKPMMDLIIKKSECDVNEILFCDDKIKFIKIAKEFGFKTHHYKDLISFKKTLKQLDVL